MIFSEKIFRFRRLLALCIVLLIAGGCDDSPSGPPGFNGENGNNEPPPGGPACKAASAVADIESLHKQASEVRRSAERIQHLISDEVPGFGGMFMDDSRAWVVNLKERSAEGAVHSLLSSGRAAMKIDPAHTENRNIEFQDAEFTFRELAAWRELATAFLLAGREFDFVLSSQVHERANRVAIGIDQSKWTDENLAHVKDFMTGVLSIPADAVLFESEYPETDEYAEDFETLSGDTFDRQRPLVGGLRVRYGSSNCTMGFLGLYDGEEVFITNGHCTENPHATSYTLYYQGERNSPADAVGTEMADGPQSLDMCVTQNSDCWPCRWSDSAVVGIRENVGRARGYIAKTDWKSEQWMVEGSREVDEEDPVFTIVDIETDILTGTTLHKVGGSSGWTSGEVTRTCVDSRRSSHELILQCQYRARYATSGGGTSGSPVFMRVESDDPDVVNPVALAGIHRASSNRDQPGGYSAFSPIEGILHDFEELTGLTIEE